MVAVSFASSCADNLNYGLISREQTAVMIIMHSRCNGSSICVWGEMQITTNVIPCDVVKISMEKEIENEKNRARGGGGGGRERERERESDQILSDYTIEEKETETWSETESGTESAMKGYQNEGKFDDEGQHTKGVKSEKEIKRKQSDKEPNRMRRTGGRERVKGREGEKLEKNLSRNKWI